jgi:hypothetical protein
MIDKETKDLAKHLLEEGLTSITPPGHVRNLRPTITRDPGGRSATIRHPFAGFGNEHRVYRAKLNARGQLEIKKVSEDLGLASRFIAKEMHTGKYPRKQAVAIGLSRARAASAKAKRSAEIQRIMKKYA